MIPQKWARWISVSMYGLIVFCLAGLFVPVLHRMVAFLFFTLVLLLGLEAFGVRSERRRLWARLSSAMLVVGYFAFFNEITHVSRTVAHWAPWVLVSVLGMLRILGDRQHGGREGWHNKAADSIPGSPQQPSVNP